MSDEANPGGKATAGVLICDDNEAIRVLLRAVVSTRHSLRIVGEAADGNQAIAEAGGSSPT